jgi:hypothetical protein
MVTGDEVQHGKRKIIGEFSNHGSASNKNIRKRTKV